MPSLTLARSLRSTHYNSEAPLLLFEDWFLASGTWDSAGKWNDYATWSVSWFLSGGTANVFGIWNDGESWV